MIFDLEFTFVILMLNNKIDEIAFTVSRDLTVYMLWSEDERNSNEQ